MWQNKSLKAKAGYFTWLHFRMIASNLGSQKKNHKQNNVVHLLITVMQN